MNIETVSKFKVYNLQDLNSLDFELKNYNY